MHERENHKFFKNDGIYYFDSGGCCFGAHTISLLQMIRIMTQTVSACILRVNRKHRDKKGRNAKVYAFEGKWLSRSMKSIVNE